MVLSLWRRDRNPKDPGANDDILHDKSRSHTAPVTDLLRGWKWKILKHDRTQPMSPCDYDFFAKVKEPLRGIWYTTQEVNLSMLKGGQYGTSIKMDALMVYDIFQIFGGR